MSRVTPELDELVDLFCEGSMSVEQAGRLEALVHESDEVGVYLRDSFEVHCELAWEFGRETTDFSPQLSADEAVLAALRAKPQWRKLGRRLRWWAVAASAIGLLFAVTLGLMSFFHPARTDNVIADVCDMRWCDESAPALNTHLSAGSKLAFQRGLLELRFRSGVRMTVQGPAEVEVQSPLSTSLVSGRLTADVPATVQGFAIQTPNCKVVDLGTRFGITCQARQTDVEVFAGSVLLRLEGPPPGAHHEQRLAANNAVRVTGVPGQDVVTAQPIAAGSRNYVQSMAGSAAMLRALEESESHLIHSYPFEGATLEERLRDRRGNLDLREVKIRDGNDGGQLVFSSSLSSGGPDPSLQVAGPFRTGVAALRSGQSRARGCGLQSNADFQPPPRMTVELLMRFAGTGKTREGFVSCALSARHNRKQCGFLLAAIRTGELAFLLDGGSEWLQSGFKFVPGRWYYVAATYNVKQADTEINAHVADLSEKRPTLKWIVRNQMVRGVPAPALLGIGEGFDGEMASAFPWAGELGSIALYDTLLERQTLESHLQALTSRD
jgi:hypothetical protein